MQPKGQRIQINKDFTSYFESVRFYISFICLIKGIKITANDNLIIANFMVDGYNEFTKKKILEELKLCQNKQVLTNCLSKYRSLGIIKKDNHSESLCKELDITLGTKLNLIELKIINK